MAHTLTKTCNSNKKDKASVPINNDDENDYTKTNKKK